MKKQLNDKIYVEVNGIRQGMFLESQDTEHPVLLFLHGGPGGPEIAFTQDYPTGLETIFIVCWWEQRGAGLSYSPNIPEETMTMEQMIADAVVVANYLRQRFGKEKIYLMGHSWGSVLGILTVQKSPELFYAYIGIGQVVWQVESERQAYTFMLQAFRAAGNKKMVRKLEKYPIDQGAKASGEYLTVRTEGMIKLGIGNMHHQQSVMDTVMPLLRYRRYTWGEKMKFIKGSLFSIKHLWDLVLQMNFAEQVQRLEVPVYILQGKFDYQVSYNLAREYVKLLEAPGKGFYTFEDSAHSPCFEEPEKMLRIIEEDVLQSRFSLADDGDGCLVE